MGVLICIRLPLSSDKLTSCNLMQGGKRIGGAVVIRGRKGDALGGADDAVFARGKICILGQRDAARFFGKRDAVQLFGEKMPILLDVITRLEKLLPTAA